MSQSTSKKNHYFSLHIWKRFSFGIGLTLIWLFAWLFLLGELSQEAYATQIRQPSQLSPNNSPLVTDLCAVEPEALADISLGVSNQPSSSRTGDQLAFWSTGNLDGSNTDGNLEVFRGVANTLGDFSFTHVTSSTGSILGGFNLAPAISANGRYIAFFSDRNLTPGSAEENPDENFEIFWYDAEASSSEPLLKQVTNTSGGSNILPSISNDGLRIAFVSDSDLVGGSNANQNPEIFVAEVKNNGQNIYYSQVTSTTQNVINDQPVISDDGQHVVFTRDDGQLYFAPVMPPNKDLPLTDQSEIIRLTTPQEDVINEQPSISNRQNGRNRIAFVSNGTHTDTLNIFLATIENNQTVNIEPITNDSTYASEQPSISADGVRIAFASKADLTGGNPEHNFQIFVYDSDANSFLQLTDGELGTETNNQPSISQNGTQVAFISQGDLYQTRCPFTDLEVQLTAGEIITAGIELVYEIKAINLGPLPASGVILTDIIPANTRFNASQSSEEWNCPDDEPGTVCELQIGDLEGLTYPVSEAFEFAVTVLSNIENGIILTNKAGIIGNELDRNIANNTDLLADTTVVRDTELLIEVSAIDELLPGNEIAYTLKVTNTGSSDVLSATVTSAWNTNDVLFNPDINDATLISPTEVQWSELVIPASDPPEPLLLTLILDLNDSVEAGLHVLTNTVQIEDDLGSQDNDEFATTVNAKPELALSKNDGGVEPTPDQAYVYTLSYANNGDQEATGVVLTETVPANTSFDSAASTPGWNCPDNSLADTTCTFPIGSLMGGNTLGELLFAVTVNEIVPAGADEISNTAEIDDDHQNGSDPLPNNNQNTILTTLDAQPDLQVSKNDDGSQPLAGDTIVYTLQYANIGDQGATGVELAETVPPNTSFNNDASTPGWSCPDGTNCTFEVGLLTAGGTPKGVDFAVTVDNPLDAGAHIVTNVASIEDDGENGADDNPDDNTSLEVTTTLNAAPDLQLSKTDNQINTQPGGSISYILTYSNEGTQDTTYITLTETIPEYTTFNPDDSTDGWDCQPNNNAGSTCELGIPGLLEVDESDTALFAVTVDEPVLAGADEIINTASITDNAVNGPDLDPSNNNATPDTTTLTASPDLRVSIDDDNITATPNNLITYTLNYANLGNQEATGVVLTEFIPDNTSFNVDASDSDWDCESNICTLEVGSLTGEGASGSSGSVTFAVTVDYPLLAGITEITNNAMISAASDPLSNSDSQVTGVDAEPNLQVSKENGQDSVEPSEVVTYILNYSNLGDQNATGVVITETVPNYTTFNEAASTGTWSCDDNSPPDTICEHEVGSLSGGGISDSVIFGVTVTPLIPAGIDQLINTTTISDKAVNGPDPDLSDNEAVDSDSLNALPDLQLSIDSSTILVEPNDRILYNLTYTNAGNQGAIGVLITEIVPVGTIFDANASTPGWDCPNGSGAGTACTLALSSELPGGGESNSVLFAVTVNSPIAAGIANISNHASITDDQNNGADANPDDNNDSYSIPINAQSDLQLNKSDDDITVEPGDTISYTLTYSNLGNQETRGVVITETVPLHTSFSPTGSTQDWNCEGNNAGSRCTYSVGDLAGGGAGGQVIFPVIVDDFVEAAVTEINNNAIMADNGSTGTVSTASATDTTPVDAQPDLELIKFDGDIIAQPGDTIPYTLGYANIGNQEATGVVITETVPAHTTFNEADSTGDWTCANNSVVAGTSCTYEIDSLGDDLGNTVIFAVTVVEPIVSGVDVITNTASIGDDGNNGVDSNFDNNSASEATSINAEADLLLSKDDGGITVLPGGTIAYTLTYTNAGNQDVTGVVLTETVPANTRFDQGSSHSAWSCDDNSPADTPCAYTIGTLNAGAASESITFTVTVSDSLLSGVNQITNIATIVDDGSNSPIPASDTVILNTPLQAQPNLTLTKSDGGISVEPGESIAYALTYSNIGNQGATGVVLTETVPLYTTFDQINSSAGWTCSNGSVVAGTICTHPLLTAVESGESGVITFTVQLSTSVNANVESIFNTASIGDNGENGAEADPSDNISLAFTPLVASPDLELTKTDNGATAEPGQTVSYILEYSNIGNQGATGVQITETVPAHTTFDQAANTDNWNCTPDSSAGAICTHSIGPVAANAGGDVTFVTTVDNPLVTGVNGITNTASIGDDGNNGFDSNPGNNSATEPTSTDAEPDLVLSKDDGGITVLPGGTITYTLTYTNVGSQDATNVVLSETVPANTTFNGSTDWNCAGTSAGSTCTYNVAAVNAGAPSQSVTFTVTVLNPVLAGVLQIENRASITDDGNNGNDADTSNNSATDTTPIGEGPNLSLTKSEHGVTARPGQSIAYALTYTNTGTRGATSVVLSETVPLYTTFNKAGSSPSWNCVDGAPAGMNCLYEIDTVESGDSGVITFTVQVSPSVIADLELITNTASISDNGDNGADSDPSNNSDTDNTLVEASPDLELTKDDQNAIAEPGQTISYILTYRNIGNQGATGVQITETVPAHTTFNQAANTDNWNCTPDSSAGSICTHSIGPVAANAGGDVTFATTVDNPLVTGVNAITNTARIGDDGNNGVDSNLGNNSDTELTSTDAEPDLVLSKDDGGITVLPGGTITYTLTYTNVGSQDATNVVLSETVPANTTFSGSTGWNCPSTSAGSTCTYDVPAVNAGAPSQSVTFAVTVLNPVLAGVLQIENRASITDDGNNGSDADTSNNSATDTTPIGEGPNLSLTKSDNGISAQLGQLIAYALTYTNTGNRGATDVELSETIPLYTTFDQVGSPGWTCPDGNSAGMNCTYTIPTAVESGDSATVPFTVQVTDSLPADVNFIANTASIADDGSNGTEADSSDNTTNSMTVVEATPDLQLTKDDQGAVPLAGSTISYLLSYSNVGNQGATDIVLTETVPANTTFNQGDSDVGWACPSASAGTICTFGINELPSGDSGSVTFAVTIDLIVTLPAITNNASIADDGSNGDDPTPANNNATETTSFLPDLELTKDDGGITASPGDTIVYTLTYTNAGFETATGVVLSDTVPEHTSFNPSASSLGWTCLPNNNAGSTCSYNVLIPIASLNRGEVYFAVTVNNTVAAGITEINNTASISDDGTNGIDPNSSNNRASDNTPIDVEPDLQLTKDDGGITVEPGGNITYTLSYTNAGNQSATAVMLTETVPANTTFNPNASHSDWNCPSNNAGSSCTFSVDELAGGGAGDVVTFTVTVLNPLLAGVNTITNTASIGDDGNNGEDSNLNDNTDSDQTPVNAEPSLILSKDDGVSATAHGETLTYTLTITNTGNQEATDLTLTDTLPISTTFVSASDGATHNGDLSGGVVTWTIASLAGSVSTTRTLTVIVTDTWAAGINELVNQALVTDDGQNSNAIGVAITDSVTLTTTVPSPLRFCSSPNSSIPNNNTTGVSDPIIIPSNTGYIIDLNVAITVTHNQVNDLIFILQDVDGDNEILINRPSCNGNDIDVILDDESTQSVDELCAMQPPQIAIDGMFKPNNPLNVFDGQLLDGDWRLTVFDIAGGPSGTLVEWCLLPTVISSPPSSPVPSPFDFNLSRRRAMILEERSRVPLMLQRNSHWYAVQ